jgi:hypothetical protein
MCINISADEKQARLIFEEGSTNMQSSVVAWVASGSLQCVPQEEK